MVKNDFVVPFPVVAAWRKPAQRGPNWSCERGLAPRGYDGKWNHKIVLYPSSSKNLNKTHCTHLTRASSDGIIRPSVVGSLPPAGVCQGV